MDTKPKPFVFVLMPFEDKFTEIYQLGIKTACENVGAYCERVDEQLFNESILARIYKEIYKADIIISDMTSRNANVFYETGYAHALNKQVILLTQNADDIPFDLKHYPHIVYEGKIIKLRDQLEQRIQWCIENPGDKLASVDVNLEIFINQTLIENEPEIKVLADKTPNGQQVALVIGVHNLSSKILRPNSFSLAITLPKILEAERLNVSSITWISDDLQVINLNPIDTLFPDGWDSIYFYCRVLFHKLSEIRNEPSIPIMLRLFTELGPRNFPITLTIELKEDKPEDS